MQTPRKGFTLAELLIVLAILAVLIAIAIPAYAAQLEQAKVKVDEANLRAAESMARATYQLQDQTGHVCYAATQNGNSMTLYAEGGVPKAWQLLTLGPGITDTELAFANPPIIKAAADKGRFPAQSAANKDKYLVVFVTADTVEGRCDVAS